MSDFIKGNHRYSAYKKTVEIASHLGFHIDGYTPKKENSLSWITPVVNDWFDRLIIARRPSESSTIAAYRKTIYSARTKQTCFKVISSLNKIVRSEDWNIDYSKSEQASRVAEGETLEDYAEHNFPFHKSITNWAYSIGLQNILEDPNGVFVVLPLNFEIETNEHYKPFVSFVPSRNLYSYTEDEIIYLTDKTKLVKEKYVPVFAILTRESYTTLWKEGDFWIEEAIPFPVLTRLPAWKAGGRFTSFIDNVPIYESFLNPMLPSLDEAAREYSDLQAEVVQHVHSTMWAIGGQKCKVCSGKGKVPKSSAEGGWVACGTCKGGGQIDLNPFSMISLQAPDIDKHNTPVPPMGYVQKQTEIVKIQDERVNAHLVDALSSINFEFLAKTPLNESGKAKEVDKDELNNYVYRVAWHLVENNIIPLYETVSEWRYALQEPKFLELVPKIFVPERFDLLSESVVTDQLSKLKEAEVSPLIIEEVQLEFINKRFNDTPEVRDKLITITELNPFSTLTQEQIAELEVSGNITKLDSVKGIYMDDFVEQAIKEDEGFLEMDYKDKKAITDKMADEKLAEFEPEKELPELDPETGLPVVPVLE